MRASDSTTTVLLVGLKPENMAKATHQLQTLPVRLMTATSVSEVESAFESARIDHVITGAGLDIETRLDVVRHVFSVSSTTSVHMKDFGSGSGGFPSFAGRVLVGLAGDSPINTSQ
jgi:hypothetical protein